jgi:hypothetical protein
MDSKTILCRLIAAATIPGCEAVTEELLMILEEKDRQLLNLSNSLNECKEALSDAKEYSLSSVKFIQDLREATEGKRSDIADLCNDFLGGREVDFTGVEKRYAKCIIPVEAEGFHFSIPVTYDTLTTLF